MKNIEKELTHYLIVGFGIIFTIFKYSKKPLS